LGKRLEETHGFLGIDWVQRKFNGRIGDLRKTWLAISRDLTLRGSNLLGRFF